MYLVGEKTCSEWVNNPNAYGDVFEVLKQHFKPLDVVRLELYPESSVLQITSNETKLQVKLERNTYAQHYDPFMFPVLKASAKYWCVEAQREVNRLEGYADTIVQTTYFPDFELLKIETTNPDQIAYVPNVKVTVDS